MKHLVIAAALFCGLLFCGCQSTSSEKPKDLVLTAASRYQIVYPDRSKNSGTTRMLKQTAELMRLAFKETIGADFPVVSESRRSAGMKSIFLGNTRTLKAKGVRPLAFKNFEFRIWEHQGNLYIAGSDRHRFNSSRSAYGHRQYIMGTTRGVIYFLEKFLDVRFLYPGAPGTDFVKKSEVRIPGRYKYKGVPTINHAPGRNYDFFYDYANSNFGPGTLMSHGGHSYYAAVPVAKYAKSNPEYYAMQGTGKQKKRNSSGNHLCISNKEVQELIYKQVIASLDQGAEITELAQTDGYQPCLCDGCVKFGNTDDQGEKLWILHRSIAERVLKARPGKKVMIISYGPTVKPPKSFKEFPDNVMIELCSYTPASFEAWSKIKVPHGFLVYIYNWGYYNMTGLTPKRTPDFAARQARLFIKNKVKGVYRCGFGENFGMEGPTYYVYGKLLEDPARSEVKILDEFYRRAFKECYAPMKVFFDTLYHRLELYSTLSGDGFEGDSGAVRAIPRNPRIIMSMIYTADILDVLEKQLVRAESMAKDPKVKKRLELVRHEFNYTKNLSEVLAFYSVFRLRPDKQNRDVLFNAIEARNNMINSWYDAKGKLKPFPGWKEIPLFASVPKGIAMTNGRLRAPIEAPLTWNVKLLRKLDVIPGAAQSRMVIKKTAEQVTFADFNKGAWAKAQWQKLNGIQLGEVSEQTRFKMLYDEKNLYVAVESQLPDSRKHTAFGADGPAWREDALEFVIDPAGLRNSYYHMIVNPVANSFYDSAVGFIEDVLDPRYNKADAGWNGSWKYEFKRQNNKWYAMITFPFADFKVKPASGMIWTMNVGREIHIPQGKGRTTTSIRELALWSPSLESLSFHDKDSFGEAVFE
ncbi:MAG: DUF4838 domain-containing protein [Lentisphaeria bacterium]|nr:DUF4838 domain-containing protein [Lentisphaeria bacterium]